MKFLKLAIWSSLFLIQGCSTPKNPPPVEFRHGTPLSEERGYHETNNSQGAELSWTENPAPSSQSPVEENQFTSSEPLEDMPDYIFVKEGETLFEIAKKYGKSGSDLIQWNGLTTPYTISPGKKLWLINPASRLNLNHGIDKDETHRETNREIIEDLRREEEVIHSHMSVSSDVSKETDYGSSKTFSLPVAGKKVLQKKGLILKIHALKGTSVKAAGAGEVIYSGAQNNNLGQLILIQHPNKLVTVYGHLANRSVNKGMKVKAGQLIGSVGQSGNAPRPQLHFEVRRGLVPLPPLNYLHD